MQDMQSICCPNPRDSVIVPDQRTAPLRKLLLYTCYAEGSISVAKMLVFSFLTGFFNLIALWILYLSYATMHYCQTLIVGFGAAMDIVMVATTWTSLRLLLASDTFLFVLFWVIFAFAVCKLALSIVCYSAFKSAFFE